MCKWDKNVLPDRHQDIRGIGDPFLFEEESWYIM
jgi:hypothetical protein